MIDAGCYCDSEDGVLMTQEVETLLMNNDDAPDPSGKR